VPQGAFVVSDPNSSIDLENCIQEAKKIFAEMFPTEEFIPEVPSPDDITWEDEIADDQAKPTADSSTPAPTEQTVFSTASPTDLD